MISSNIGRFSKFEDSLTGTLTRKFAIEYSLKIPPHVHRRNVDKEFYIDGSATSEAAKTI